MDGTPYKQGDILRRPKLARTLSVIAREGADVFYTSKGTGSLSDQVLQDISDHGIGLSPSKKNVAFFEIINMIYVPNLFLHFLPFQAEL